MLRGTYEKRGEECSVSILRLELKFGRVREENSSLAAAVREYEVRW